MCGSFVKQGLVDLVGLEALHLFHSEAEGPFQTVHLFVGDAQHALEVVMSTAHFVRINVHGRARLQAQQRFGCFFVLDKLKADGAVAGDAIFQQFP